MAQTTSQAPEIRDRNGFLITSSACVDAYKSCIDSDNYKSKLKRRNQRWQNYRGGYEVRNRRLKTLIRKGVPPNLRGQVWFAVSPAREMLETHPGEYSKLVSRIDKEHLASADQIEMDLHRTFPEHYKYSRYTEEGSQGMNSLRRVLCAYSLRNPTVGYCQGLNFIAAYLLLFLSEEESFWMLAAIVEKLLPGGYYTDTMAGVHVDQKVFQNIVTRRLPLLAQHMEKIGMVVEFACLQWFLCLFSRTFPSDTVLRVWDAFFYEGAKILFRVGVAVLQIHEHQLLTCNDPHEFCVALQNIASSLFDCDLIMKSAFKMRRFKGGTIIKMRDRFSEPIVSNLEADLERRKSYRSQVEQEEQQKKEKEAIAASRANIAATLASSASEPAGSSEKPPDGDAGPIASSSAAADDSPRPGAVTVPSFSETQSQLARRESDVSTISSATDESSIEETEWGFAAGSSTIPPSGVPAVVQRSRSTSVEPAADVALVGVVESPPQQRVPSPRAQAKVESGEASVPARRWTHSSERHSRKWMTATERAATKVQG